MVTTLVCIIGAEPEYSIQVFNPLTTGFYTQYLCTRGLRVHLVSILAQVQNLSFNLFGTLWCMCMPSVGIEEDAQLSTSSFFCCSLLCTLSVSPQVSLCPLLGMDSLGILWYPKA